MARYTLILIKVFDVQPVSHEIFIHKLMACTGMGHRVSKA